MSPFEAAFEYIRLVNADDVAGSIRFALAYENSAAASDYAEYLDILDNKLAPAAITVS